MINRNQKFELVKILNELMDFAIQAEMKPRTVGALADAMKCIALEPVEWDNPVTIAITGEQYDRLVKECMGNKPVPVNF